MSRTFKSDNIWKNLKLDKKYWRTTCDIEWLTGVLGTQMARMEMNKKRKPPKDTKPILILIDDFALDRSLERSGALEMLSIRGRHYGCNVVYISQKYKACPNVTRFNSSDIILFNNISRAELNQVHEENSTKGLSFKEFERSFLIATAEPYSFFYIRRRRLQFPDAYFSNFTHQVNIHTGELDEITLPAKKMEKEKIKKVYKLNKKRRKRKKEIFASTDENGRIIDSSDSDYGVNGEE